mmetsp:Transcript_1485/g.2250  ORF Transcript_1485/g.2250 Transcript_1485/m.2250 type:complete len:212 (-) Transcript_1485:1018-1653(-)
MTVYARCFVVHHHLSSITTEMIMEGFNMRMMVVVLCQCCILVLVVVWVLVVDPSQSPYGKQDQAGDDGGGGDPDQPYELGGVGEDDAEEEHDQGGGGGEGALDAVDLAPHCFGDAALEYLDFAHVETVQPTSRQENGAHKYISQRWCKGYQLETHCCCGDADGLDRDGDHGGRVQTGAGRGKGEHIRRKHAHQCTHPSEGSNLHVIHSDRL